MSMIFMCTCLLASLHNNYFLVFWAVLPYTEGMFTIMDNFFVETNNIDMMFTLVL